MPGETDSEKATRPLGERTEIPGFKLVENACEDQSTGTRRLYLRHLYQGKADKYAARKFYREQMPRARWALVSDRNVKGEYTLRFEKGTESCTLHITDGEGRMSRNIRIQVIIVQEERGQSSSNARKKIWRNQCPTSNLHHLPAFYSLL